MGKGTWENAEGLFRKLSEDGATSEADLTSIQRGLRWRESTRRPQGGANSEDGLHLYPGNSTPVPHGPYHGVLDCRPQTLMLNGNSHGPMVLGPTPLTRLSQCTAHTHGRQNTRTQDKNHPFIPTHPLTERNVWVFLRSRCRRSTHATFQSRIRVSEQSKQAQQADLSMTTVARMAK